MSIFAEYDPEARALYVELKAGEVARTVEVEDGLAIDLDAESRPLSFEALEVPVRRQQLDGLAARFGFRDNADEAWAATQRAQPAQPARSGVLIFQTLEYPFGHGPIAVGASSNRVDVEAHEFVLSA
jgi:hypothetical protein